MSEVIYASWGGNGRGIAVRRAFEAAVERDAGLTYLAILDQASFGDLDKTYLDLVVAELEWLLEAQLHLVSTQLGATDHPARILVRTGSVYEEIAKVVANSESSLVLIPSEVAEAASSIESATGATVETVDETN